MQSIELFAGAGGLGLGAERAGASPTLIVESDKWCCETLRLNKDQTLLNWPEPNEEDIRFTNYEKVGNDLDLVTGGPPCQPFSLGGKHRAFDDSRDMWPEAVRSVRETQPKAFVFENVKGLMRDAFSEYTGYISLQLTYPDIEKQNDEHWLEHMQRLQQHHSSGNLSGLKYQLMPPRILNAADYGVPQRRDRVFFVGFRDDIAAHWSFPKPTHSLDALLHDQSDRGVYWDLHQVAKKSRQSIKRKPKEFDSELLPWRTVRDALKGLPDPQKNSRAAEKFENHRYQSGAKVYPGHTGSPLDLPAKALKAGVHGVPGGENMMVRDDGSVRYFSVRESARLQTFPDGYKFSGSWSEAMRQLGNAVPVDLACVVIGSVVEHLAEKGSGEDVRSFQSA